MKRKLCAWALIAALIAALLPNMIITASAIESRSEYFNTDYTLCGNGAIDIVAVANAQVGMSASDFNYSDAWCAAFISDCAKLAGVSDAVPWSGSAGGLRQAVIDAGGTYQDYYPSSYISDVLAGDILLVNNSVSYRDYNHAALVVAVDADTIYCVDGNWSNGVRRVTRYRDNSDNNPGEQQTIVTIVRPQYKTFVSENYRTDLTVKAAAAVGLYQEAMVSDSYLLSTAAAGTEFHAVGLVMDTAGAWWYQVEADSSGTKAYLIASSAELLAENLSVSVIGARNPSATVSLGQSCNIGGVVKTGGCLISEVEAAVYAGTATEGTAVINSRQSPNVTYYDLSGNINQNLSFGKITSAGSYTYLVRATIRSYHLENNQLVNRQQTVILSETVTEFTVVKPDYTVTFNANGGTCSISSMSVQAGKTLSGFPDVTRKGYNFLGWYTQTSGGTQVTLSTKIQSSMTLYAQWEKIDLGEACGKNVYWKLQNGVLTISGTGAMTDYSDADSVPWHDTKSSIHSVIVGQGVTNIGSYAFDGCTELTSVTLSEGLTAIGSSAFAGCGKLTGITMPATLKTIGEKAFISCVVLTDVVIPYGVTAIGADAFSCMSSLSSITVPATVTGIGDRCFAFSTNLTAVSLGGKPASMGSNLLMMDTKAVIYYRTDSGWNAAAKSAFVGTQSNLSWKSVGDVNGDGSVTLKDVSAAFNAVKGTKALTCTFQMSDVHVDGKLTLRDVAAIFDLVS